MGHMDASAASVGVEVCLMLRQINIISQKAVSSMHFRSRLLPKKIHSQKNQGKKSLLQSIRL